jgi:hypothetical protein
MNTIIKEKEYKKFRREKFGDILTLIEDLIGNKDNGDAKVITRACFKLLFYHWNECSDDKRYSSLIEIVVETRARVSHKQRQIGLDKLSANFTPYSKPAMTCSVI